MTVLDVIQKTTAFFERKGIDHPRLQIELLLAQVLGLPRLQLYLNFERILSEGELEQIRDHVRRRGQREPLQHILGTTSFCGLEIRVSRDVLVPRPETELLAEQAWKRLEALARSVDPAPAVRALEFGTGSGCIAIAIAQHCPSVEITAIDISQEALGIARSNAQTHAVQDRIHFAHAASCKAIQPPLAFDVIVSNPPYIPTREIDSLMPEVRLFDPHLALNGGVDGLDFYRQLADEARPLIRPEGILLLEIGDGQAVQVSELLREHDWVVEPPILDYASVPRILAARRK
jgi:release factor glutamine methyltransferase